MPKKKESSSIKAQLIEVYKPIDIARYACSFGLNNYPIYSVKNEKGYMIFIPGGKISEIRSVFYSNIEKTAKFFVYSTSDTEEKAEMQDNPKESEHYRSYRIPIIELKKIPYEEQKGKRQNVIHIKAVSSDSIVKNVIANSLENEEIGHVYCFSHEKRTYVCAFGLIDDDKTTTMMYAQCKQEKRFSFFRYNYQNDVLETSETITGNAYIFVRVINLARPFSFFKPE